MKSDLTIHLAQWQYWWWFWFSFLWGFYYLVAIKIIRGRVLKFKPRIFTSYRSHGKWGDFLACIVPAIWCLNILTSSNFIMRMLEWQHELSLFNIRIRGRQWYWVYKFELRHIIDFASTPKSIGFTKWLVNIGPLWLVSDDYLCALQLRNTSTATMQYWQNSLLLFVALLNDSTYELDRVLTTVRSKFIKAAVSYNPIFELDSYPHINLYNFQSYYPHIVKASGHSVAVQAPLRHRGVWSVNHFERIKRGASVTAMSLSPLKVHIGQSLLSLAADFTFWKSSFKPQVTYIDKTGKVVPLFESTRAARNTEVQESPVLLTNEDFSFLKALTLPRRFFDPYSVGFTQARRVKSKESNVLAPFVIKQKRVKDNNPIPLKIKSHECDPLVAAKLGLVPIQPTLFASGALRSLDIYTSAAYRLTAKGKSRDELMSVQLSRRLLRTQRTLMLPSHTNLTIVTNSYDVVHSWFLPSLGLKMDCVPGRSTHHTFYVDSLGFFYGQCAEICGRYHHHMPIRICMLPFEHFFVWWQHFGMPRVLNLDDYDQDALLTAPSRFIW